MTDYTRLSRSLMDAHAPPTVAVVDLQRFDNNLAQARKLVAPGMAIRLVAKSLPCLVLLRRAAEALGTDRLMTFSDQMLTALLKEAPEFGHLIGKPFPVDIAAQVIAGQPEAVDKVHWLLDTRERIAEYAKLSRRIGRPLNVALEVNIGLNRGGIAPDDLASLVLPMELRVTALMAYEVHIASLPALLRRRERRRITAGLASVAAYASRVGPEVIVNIAGSQTFDRYGTADATEVSFGSILVKPGDFEIPGREGFHRAAFLATRILKYLPGNPIPGIGHLRRLLPSNARSQIGIWGGYWKADPLHPAGYRYSRVFGRSTNQEIWTGPLLSHNPVGTYAVLHPRQSEAVLDQFGDLAILGPDGSVHYVPTLP